MPRGRKIGPLLPSGGGYGFGYKALTTKKRLAAKAAAWDAIATGVPQVGNMVSTATAPKRRGRAKMIGPLLPPGGYKTLVSNYRLANKEAQMAGLPIPKRAVTESQLAALAKGRATRAAKKTGNIVAVAVAAPTTVKKSRAGRPRLSEEEKQLRKEKKETEK